MDTSKNPEHQSNWQTDLDQNLARRLLQRASQPGLNHHDLASNILLRAKKMVDRQPVSSLQSSDFASGKNLFRQASNPVFARGSYGNSVQEAPPAITKIKPEAGIRTKRRTVTSDHGATHPSYPIPTGPGLSPGPPGKSSGKQPENQSKQTVTGPPIRRKSWMAQRQPPTAKTTNSSIGGLKNPAADRIQNSGSVSNGQQNTSAAQAIRRRAVLREPAALQNGPARRSREDTRQPDLQNAAGKITSSNTGAAGPDSLRLMQPTPPMIPETGKKRSATIGRQADVPVNTDSPHEKSVRRMSRPSASGPVYRVPNLRKAGDLQPAIRRLAVNHQRIRSARRVDISSIASSQQSPGPGERRQRHRKSNPSRSMGSAATSTSENAEAIGGAPPPPAASEGSGNPAGAAPPQRLDPRVQPHRIEPVMIQKAAGPHGPAPPKARSELSPRTGAIDLGTAILQRYSGRAAKSLDAIQKKAPLRMDNLPAFAENRNMTLANLGGNPAIKAPTERSMADSLPAFGSYHPGGPLATGNTAAGGAGIQSKPDNTATGAAGSLTDLSDDSTSGEGTVSKNILGPEGKPDLDELVAKVWRKIMRQLAVESERRGLQNWHYQN